MVKLQRPGSNVAGLDAQLGTGFCQLADRAVCLVQGIIQETALIEWPSLRYVRHHPPMCIHGALYCAELALLFGTNLHHLASN